MAELGKLQDDVPAIPYADIAARIDEDLGASRDELYAAGVDRARLVQTGVDAYFVQIFELGAFHADPHQGKASTS